MKISVIVLSLNEGLNIVHLCDEIHNSMSSYDYEIIIVEDGSDMELSNLVKNLIGTSNVNIINRDLPNGLAGALITGINHSSGERIVVLDADGTHDPAYIPKLLDVVDIKKIVIASRFKKGGKMQHPLQRYTSLVFNLFIRNYLKTGVKDNLGGYFAMPRTAAHIFIKENALRGHGDYFIRLILEARKIDCEIIEVPSIYRLRFSGKPTRSRFWMLKKYLKTIFELKIEVTKFRNSTRANV